MAIQSAWLLCARLLKETPSPEMRDRAWQRGIAVRYETEWRRHFSHRLRIAAAFAHAAMRPRLLAPLLPALKVTRLLTHGADWSGKIRCVIDETDLASLRRTLEMGHDNHA